MGGFRDQIRAALGPDLTPDVSLSVTDAADLGGWFRVSDLALASFGAAASELAALLEQTTITLHHRRLLKWFHMTLRPIGWELPAAWDALAGDYQTTDGWIKLHTNAPHHCHAALSVLDCPPERGAVAEAVRGWDKTALETAIVAAGGCAAAMHNLAEWAQHPQGQAVAAEPLIHWHDNAETGRPLALDRLRVLDLTRVLAGPVATRFLAGFGADVLRIDPPEWTEPAAEQEVTLGKRCAGLDLHRRADRQRFEELLQGADVLIHGYRPGALAGLGYGPDELRRLSPALIDISLNAYGHSGPWGGRRGFDSLVQMSCGIAAEGMRQSGTDRPTPLPVQALDHATGYLIAASALRAIRRRNRDGRTMSARLSLARTATLLLSGGVHATARAMPSDEIADLAPAVEATGWGPAHRIAFPLTMSNAAPVWRHPSGPLRRHDASWS